MYILHFLNLKFKWKTYTLNIFEIAHVSHLNATPFLGSLGSQLHWVYSEHTLLLVLDGIFSWLTFWTLTTTIWERPLNFPFKVRKESLKPRTKISQRSWELRMIWWQFWPRRCKQKSYRCFIFLLPGLWVYYSRLGARSHTQRTKARSSPDHTSW